MRLITRSFLPLLLTSLAFFSCHAWAQPFEAVRLAPLPPGQDGGRLGAVFIAGTAYRGSGERRKLLVPSIDYQWGNGWFAGVSNGLGYNASSRRDLQYGPRLTLDLGRDEGRSEVLRGMGDIGVKPELGFFFNRFWGPNMTFTSSWRQGAGLQGNGVVLDLGSSYSLPVGGRTRVSLGMSAHWVNAGYMQDFFGVSPAQSAVTGYAISQPGAGWRDIGVNLGLSHRWGARTFLVAGLAGSSLLGEARDSVLTTRKAMTLTGIAALSYAF